MSADAESGPLLDLGKNNSTSLETEDYARYDCRHVYSNFQFENLDEETASYRCKQWDCYCCGYHMRMNLVEEIQRICKERPSMSRLLTLTLDPSKIPNDEKEQHRYLTGRWNALRTRLKREIGDFSFIWVQEQQDSGVPHLHAIVSRYLPQQVIARAWNELGGGKVVDIRRIDRVEKVANYVGKYLTKDALSGLPKGTQRYGSSQDIDLDVRSSKESDDQWTLVVDDLVNDVRRGVESWDFVIQRNWGGPKPPPGHPLSDTV